MKVVPYTNSDFEEWDDFLSKCYNATFLHSRRFLSYHGVRFEDASLRILDRRGRLIGLFPAAVSPTDPKEVISHPGITYGGIVHGRELRGTNIIECLEQISSGYRARGFERLLYKAIPTVYQLSPSEDDLYALFRVGAERTRCDLSAAIDLPRWDGAPTRSLRNSLKRARNRGLRVESSIERLPEFWAILTKKLSKRHSTKPVHTLIEIQGLSENFPENIQLVTAILSSEVVAGVLLFHSSQTTHAQYGACNAQGAAAGALDFVIETSIRDAALRKLRYFDFGISNELDGTVLNAGLHRSKEKFGASGITHEFYSLRLGTR